MIPEFRVFLAAAPALALLCVAAFIAVLPYRKELTAQPVLAILALSVFLLATSLAELAAPAGPWTYLFAKLEYVGFLALPMAWLSFCLRFTGWITFVDRRLVGVAVIVPTALFLFAMTNDLHRLVWTDIAFRESGGFSVLRAGHGPGFWVLATYSWGCVAFGTALVFLSFLKSARQHHRQSVLVLVGALLPGVPNAVNNLGFVPHLQKDFTPLGFAFAGILFAFGLYLARLVFVMPVARAVIVQELRMAIVAVDAGLRVVDHNAAADALFGLDSICVGRPAGSYGRLSAFFETIGFGAREAGISDPGLAGGVVDLGRESLSWRLHASARHGKISVFTAEDVTSRVRLEAELDRARTGLLRQEKLAAVGILTAGVAHEINNPLGYIRSDLRSLRTLVSRSLPPGAPDAKEIDFIGAGLEEGLDRIEATVKSLLFLSRQERPDALPEPYDLNAGVEATLALCRGEWRGSIRVERRLAELPPVRARGREIDQVLLNLVTNAVQSIRERGSEARGVVTVMTGSGEGTVFCEIMNDGPTIPESLSDRIFEPFFSARGGDAGTGLGLSVSKDIVERRHGGRLFLASTDPVVFRIELPVRP